MRWCSIVSSCRNVAVVFMIWTLFDAYMVTSHSWMSCPYSFNPSWSRGGTNVGPCEAPGDSPIPTTQIRAGQRLKVGWPSNNHGGGYVRLSLAPWSQRGNQSAFDAGILKMACYGHDLRPGRYQYGDCNHPCYGRPGCQYQQDSSDLERYDSTIAIPYNLEDGLYVLQWIGLVGNGGLPYYSCARLQVTGGNPSMEPTTSNQLLIPSCLQAGGGGPERVLPSSQSSDSVSMGRFVFDSNGSMDVDVNIAQAVPVNQNCDPRIGCMLAVDAGLCAQELCCIQDPNYPVQICSTTGAAQPSFRALNPMTSTALPSSTQAPVTLSPSSSSSSDSEPSSMVVVMMTPGVGPRSPSTGTPVPPASPPPSEGSFDFNSSCQEDAMFSTCNGDSLARCVWSQWITQPCAPGTACRIVHPETGGGACVDIRF